MDLNYIHYGESCFDNYWNKAVADNSIVHPFYSSLLRTFDHQNLKNNLIADHSFVIVDKRDRILALVPLYLCSADGKNVYGFQESYSFAPVVFGKEISRLHQAVLQECFAHIDHSAEINNVFSHRIYYTVPTIAQGRYLCNPLTAYGYSDDSCMGLILHLDEDEEVLWSNIRKSYRPLINKALRNYEILVVEAINYDFSLCEEYRKLHFMAAGRETRPRETFHSQYKLIENDQGYLVMVLENNKCFGAYLFYHLNDSVFYASAGTDPECDSQSGVGHLGLWWGIKKAKERGAKYMDFGMLSADSADSKLTNIEFFKFGFGGRKVMVFRGTKTFPSKMS